MSSKVRTVELGEIVDITSSKRIFRKEYVESGIPFYRGKEIIEKSSGNEPSTDIYITKERYNEIKKERGVPQYKDILLTSVGTLGVPYQVQKDEVFYFKDGNLTWIKDFSNEVLPEFIYVWLKSPTAKEQINRITIGSTQQALTITSLKTLELDLPALDQQKQVCEIYYGFTDKLKANQQNNETLEAMAQAIFKSWFVDFDPVRAKIEATSAGRDPNRAAMAAIAGISLDPTSPAGRQDWDEIEATLDQKLARMPEAQQQQLSRTAQLFPDELAESEIGEVPKGWNILKLEDYLTLSYGKGLRKKDREDGKVPVYGSGGLTGTHNESLIEGPGVIVGRKGTVGSIYWEDRDFWPIDTVFYVEPKNEIDLSFYYYLLNTLGLDEMNTDAAVPGLNRNNAYRLQIPEFPEKLMKQFADFTADLHKMMRVKKAEKKTLENLRNTLLPKLISGEVGV